MKKSELKYYKIENEEWEYNGKLFKHKLEKPDLDKVIKSMLYYSFFIFLLFVFGGLQNIQATRVIYVSFPFILQVFPMLFMLIAVYKVYKYSNDILTINTHRQSYARFKSSSIILLVLSISCLLGLIVHIYSSGLLKESIFYLLSEIMIIVCSIYCVKLEQSIMFIEFNGVLKGKL